MKLLLTGISLCLFTMSFSGLPAHAATLGWWRMGDSDAPAPVDGAVIATTVNEPVGTAGDLTLSQGNPSYSTVVPGKVVHDPLTSSDHDNDWSMFIDGSAAGSNDRPRLSTGGVTVPADGFTFETYVRFGSPSNGDDFAYHTSSGSGGWRMERDSDSTIHLLMTTPTSGTGTTVVDINSTTVTTTGQWYHVGLIYEGNSQDGSDDVHLFVNHVEEASANMSDADLTFGGTTPTFFTGSVLNDNYVVGIDEPRYLDQVLNLNGSDFLDARSYISLTVDRTTGSLTLDNSSLNPNSLDILGYSITSAYGALDQAGWKPIAGHYDDSGTGNGSVDSDDAWTILSAVDSSTDLSETLLGGTPGDGGSIAPGDSVVLSQAGGAWIRSPIEDLVVEILHSDGETEPATVVYEGNGGDPFKRSDLNFDGSITSSDWDIFRDNNASDLSGLSPAKQYGKGDLDGDGDNDTNDFAIFRSDYDEANGAGSFSAMLQSVPEPTSLMLLGLASLILTLRRTRYPTMKTLCLNLLAVTLIFSFATAPARADLLGWYRMGDDDGGLTTPPVNGAPFNIPEGTLNNPLGSEGPLVPTNAGAEPTYSTVVPGTTVHNPQTGLNYQNTWAMETDASLTRARAREPMVVPGQFSYEVFVRFDDVSASRGIDFAYHRNNTNGGWQVELNTNDTVELNVNSKVDGGGLHILDLDSTTKLVDGRWYHIGVIFEGNSQDGSDDAHLYIDYQLEVSGNVPDENIFGGDEISFYNGAAISNQASRIDESRYYDEILPLDGSGFLTLARMKTLVHPTTGEMVLLNNTFQSIDLANYQINSPAGALLEGDADWNSLSDQNLDPVGGGDESGETWEESGGIGPAALAESFLLGGTTLDPGEWISIGEAYNPGIADNGMTMTYFDTNETTGVSGSVEFAVLGDMDGNGALEDADVNPFVQALTNRAAFEAAHFGVPADLVGDFDGNGQLDLGDVAGFKAAVEALSAAGAASARGVPEPSTLGLLAFALVGAIGCGRRIGGERRCGERSKSIRRM